jgi:hypothetical protein
MLHRFRPLTIPMIKHQQTQKFGPIVGNLSAKIDYDYPENDGNK